MQSVPFTLLDDPSNPPKPAAVQASYMARPPELQEDSYNMPTDGPLLFSHMNRTESTSSKIKIRRHTMFFILWGLKRQGWGAAI